MTAFTTRTRRILTPSPLILCGWLLLVPAVACAADSSDWRPTYDLVMRWLNFFILVFVIVKYSRRPLTNFLKGKQKEIGTEISRIEAKREAISQAAATARQKLDQSGERLEELKQRIVSQGEKRKLEIIADARQEGRHILESARRKVAGTILQAHNKLRGEMIDLAVAIALEKLPEKITPQDNEQLFEQFLISTRGE